MFALFLAATFVLLGGAQIWLLIYRYSIISEILGLRHSMVLILVFDGVTVKTTNVWLYNAIELETISKRSRKARETL